MMNKKRIEFPEYQIEYLKQQSSEFKALIELIGEVETYAIKDPFTSLINQIIYQSISFKAATTIWERFYDRFKPITPENIIRFSHEELKSVGLSNSKTNYIINIANAFIYKEINTDFKSLSDKEVETELIQIKGIGLWTVQMFLIFCLERENIISYGDIAIRKGLEWLYDIDHPITKDEFNDYTSLFSPYNTLASHYLWEITLRAHWNTRKND